MRAAVREDMLRDVRVLVLLEDVCSVLKCCAVAMLGGTILINCSRNETNVEGREDFIRRAENCLHEKKHRGI